MHNSVHSETNKESGSLEKYNSSFPTMATLYLGNHASCKPLLAPVAQFPICKCHTLSFTGQLNSLFGMACGCSTSNSGVVWVFCPILWPIFRLFRPFSTAKASFFRLLSNPGKNQMTISVQMPFS